MAAESMTMLLPFGINGTNYAVRGVRFLSNIGSVAARHSGNPYAQARLRNQIAPALEVRMAFQDAYSLIGFGPLAVTSIDWYMATFASYVRAGGVSHPKRSLASSATAVATIQSISEEEDRLIATVLITLLSADGVTHPLGSPANASAPTVGSEPTWHRRGPITVGGSRISGVRSFSADLGQRLIPSFADGDTFARAAVHDGGEPVITLGHGSPKDALASLGHSGSSISAVVCYLRAYSSSGLATGSTGASITLSAGEILPDEIGQAVGSEDQGGIVIRGASTSTTHPWTVSLAATMPSS